MCDENLFSLEFLSSQLESIQDTNIEIIEGNEGDASSQLNNQIANQAILENMEHDEIQDEVEEDEKENNLLLGNFQKDEVDGDESEEEEEKEIIVAPIEKKKKKSKIIDDSSSELTITVLPLKSEKKVKKRKQIEEENDVTEVEKNVLVVPRTVKPFVTDKIIVDKKEKKVKVMKKVAKI